MKKTLTAQRSSFIVALHTCLTFDQLLYSPINFLSRLAMIIASLQITYLLSATVFISENLLNYSLPEFGFSLKRTIGSYFQEVYDERRLSIDYKHPMLFPYITPCNAP